MTAELQPPDRHCIECGSVIPQSARLCPTCKSWQTWWKNTFAYWATYVGALAIIVSGAFYIVTTLYHSIHHTYEAEVLAVELPGHEVILNSGTDDIFLSHFLFKYSAGVNSTLSAKIGRELTSHKIFTQDVPPEPKGRTVSGDGSAIMPQARFVAQDDGATCYLAVIYSSNDFALDQIKSFYKEQNQPLATVEAKGQLFFYGGDSGELREKAFPVVITFAKQNRPNCPP